MDCKCGKGSFNVGLHQQIEQNALSKDSQRSVSIAVLTSGGDAQGMNAAVRAFVRMGLYSGCDVYLIREGFQGLVEGGSMIQKADWSSVAGIIHKGGTVLGSSRCQMFRERAGRLKAAKNLVQLHINRICAIGGDGTLTGMNILCQEWSGLLEELVVTNQITEGEARAAPKLLVVGIVASIDNDFAGTDLTIGADSALHRIVEATDSIMDTAKSHQRCFVLEVMGRACGFLALFASIASEADWVFLPEKPSDMDWPKKLCDKIQARRELGVRHNIIIVSEGARNVNSELITSQQVKAVIDERLAIGPRVTVLGHVQRGGNPSAFDRIFATRLGIEAVATLTDTPAYEKPVVLAMHGTKIDRVSLVKTIDKTLAVGEMISKKEFEQAQLMRGEMFAHALEAQTLLSELSPQKVNTSEDGPVIGLMTVGATACGANSVMYAFVRMALTSNLRVLGIRRGFTGLIEGDVYFMDWMSVEGWTQDSSSNLGTRREEAEKIGLQRVMLAIKHHKMRGLVIIGGFEAYLSLLQMFEARMNYRGLCIPMIMVPVTIDNNIPGTDLTVGSDTALNALTDIVDRLKKAAKGNKRRLFVVEAMGGFCGYLASMSGLAGAADVAYVNEVPFDLHQLQADARRVHEKMTSVQDQGLVVIAENAHKHFSTDFVKNVFAGEGKDDFDCRVNVPGHVQQSGKTSPTDRILGCRMGVRCAKLMEQLIAKYGVNGSEHSFGILGLRKNDLVLTDIEKTHPQTDFERRREVQAWWLKLLPLIKVMTTTSHLRTPSMPSKQNN